MSLLAELKRRRVFKVGGAYLVMAWLAVQGASIGFPTFDAPVWVLRVFILVVLLGFPIVLVFAWVFDLTPDGVKLETVPVGNKRVFSIAAVLVALALGWYYIGQPALRASGVDARSVAVLPFVNMSADPNQEFFSDGIAEELLNRLAQFPDLQVAARTSAFQFKGKNLDVAEIGRKLKVSHVLEGSVRKQGTRLRITAQLIDSASGYHLWSETYERDAADVFKVQDEISTAIATALEAKLTGRPISAVATKVADPAAYDDYLQGRAFFARRVGDNLKRAVEAYDRAIARDPTYSMAHSGRAFALASSQFWVPWLPIETTNAQALAAADEALRLDPNNAEAYLVRGTVKSGMFRVVDGRADIERAYALAPGNVDVLNFFGDDLEFTGELRRAERMKRQAMALDPLFFVHPTNLARILRGQGRFREALAMGRRAVALGGGAYAQDEMFWAQLRLGEIDAARQTLAEICKQAGAESAICLVDRVTIDQASGRTSAVEPTLAKFVAMQASGTEKSWIGLAALYANELNDIPRATAAMRKLVRDADSATMVVLLNGPSGARLPEEVSQDPAWLAVWADPKLRELMAAYRANLIAYRKGG